METSGEGYKNRRRIRPDGEAKVTGSLKYLTDLSFPEMLYGKVLRSAHPHARILSIQTAKAERLPGVQAVLTYKDIPGLNGFGIITPDQPVFCYDTVRYVGDAVAAVAADSTAIAEQALQLIEVEYEPLPVIDEPKKGLDPDYPHLHPDGNILHTASYQKGETETGFADCVVMVEETYQLPRQMHAYMETEGGVIVPEKDGNISVYVGTQHGYKDRFQLARILAMPEEKIRVISSPMGGSFGGKDELNIQPYGALLALATGRPVKIHQTRKESVTSGLKRHPMEITMKTGADKNGKILAHEVSILADTGAYATLGPAILEFAVEHATGPYIIPHVKVEGISVFTNNGVAGEFRGFGGNQITFALEGQLDRLAEKLAVDSIELRRKNIRKTNDPGPLNQRIAATNGASDVLEAISRRYQAKKSSRVSSNKWKRRGIGTAITMHGGGLGYGRLDPAGGRLSLNEDGKIEIAFSFEEVGQGILAVIETIVTEELGCAPEDIDIVIGDTARTPHSGSTTASRGTSMVWHAVQRMKPLFQEKMLEKAAQLTGVPADELELGHGGIIAMPSEALILTYEELARFVPKLKTLEVNTSFDFPTTPDPVDSGHFLYAFSAVLAEVEVDVLTGKVKVCELQQAVSAGPVVNEIGYTGQIEGGGVMALGYTLLEEALMVDGRYLTENFDAYLIPSMRDVPFPQSVEAIEELVEGDPYGPRGVGEIGSVAVAPAIAKAIHDAVGHWVCKLPVSSEKMLEATLEEGGPTWTKTIQ